MYVCVWTHLSRSQGNANDGMPVSTSLSRNPSGKLSIMTPAGVAVPPPFRLMEPRSMPRVGLTSHQNSKSFFTSFLPILTTLTIILVYIKKKTQHNNKNWCEFHCSAERYAHCTYIISVCMYICIFFPASAADGNLILTWCVNPFGCVFFYII